MPRPKSKANVANTTVNVRRKTFELLRMVKMKSNYVLTTDDVLRRSLKLYLAELRKDEDFV